MVKKFTFLAIAILLSVAVNAQDRVVARGAESGELYMSGPWYAIYAPPGPPFYDTVRTAVYHITEHGKKVTIQYDADYFNPSSSVMVPDYIIADATPGVVYNKQTYYKEDGNLYTALWVSFDNGENWTFREEKSFAIYYSGIYTNNNQHIIYRGGGGMYFSLDFGQTWTKVENSGYTLDGDIGYSECEFFGLDVNSLLYTKTCFNMYETIEIDSQFVFGNISGFFPDVYRGSLPGEVYVDSWFPDDSYRVSFSADTGQTFRHVYICDSCLTYTYEYQEGVFFMSDREPGVFYILRRRPVEDTTPWGWHLKLCIEYYRNYGETLVDTYCHDLTREGVVTRVDEVEKRDEIVVYPNPTEGQLRITNYELRITTIEVFDVFGHSVYVVHPSLREGLEALDISHLPSGMYFVRITTENGTVTKKIVKR